MWITITTGLLTAFFMLASSIKIFGWQKTIFNQQLEMFKSYGFNRTIMCLVGITEAFGAVTIWFTHSVFGPIGALALMATSFGAIGCHVIFDNWKDGIPAIITFVLSAIVAWATRAPLLELLGISDLF